MITLGIIGIVAAMTMPSIIAKRTEKQTVAKLKKAYSTLNQAHLMAISKYGSPDGWGFQTMYVPASHINLANKYVEYFKVTDNCIGKDSSYVRKHCYNSNLGDPTVSSSFVISDGITLVFRVWSQYCNFWGSTSNVCGSVTVVTADATKKPEYGKNSFNFYVTKDSIVPVGLKNDSRILFSRNCDIKSKNPNRSFSNMFACAGWVIYNENMDYLKCDNLEWDKKTKCD